MIMDSKSYAVIAIALVAGLVGGYLASSIPAQNHISDLEGQITELNEQLKVRVRIEKISWPPNAVKVEVRNTGSAIAIIESISVRVNETDAAWYVDTSNDATGSLAIGDTEEFFWDETDASAEGYLEPDSAYIIRVNCTTGFSDEVIRTSAGQSQQAQTAVRIDNVEFNATTDEVVVTVRNIGSITAEVVSVSVRETGSSYVTEMVSVSIPVGSAQHMAVDFSGSFDIVAGSHYDVKVVTSTGFENVKTNLIA
jgi:hypothetical protein